MGKIPAGKHLAGKNWCRKDPMGKKTGGRGRDLHQYKHRTPKNYSKHLSSGHHININVRTLYTVDKSQRIVP